MSNVPIEIDQDALREYLEGLPVFGEGSQTFGDVQRQFDEMERLGIIPAGQTTGRVPDGGSTDGVRVTPRDTTVPVVPPVGPGEPAPMPRPRGDEPPVEEVDPVTEAQEALAEQRRVDAFARLRSLLNRYNLGALEGNVRDLIARGITDGDAVLFELRETESFKTRFKANAKRAAAGLPELDPATYIGLENSYRSVLASNNLPIGFYDDQDDFNAFIEGAVSPGELQSRISDGYRKVQDADPEVKRQMQELYGVAEPELLAYFLDPKRARPLLDSAALRRQAEAAAIAARGREQGGLDLTRESAEALAARGITPEEAQAQFAQRGALAGLYNPLAGEEALTQEEELGATFGFDPVAAEKLARRRAQRVAEFQGGGQFARTTGATSGTVETGIGTAS
jgi:hypothetical protein